ncbi:class I SAM-dependent methyltransferase [Phenylobacterium sp.]|uniref:class I SAM-dependent methyltransferase n=1 Tax=Phenylobacterium sp. TaxID=1871053 RepID=UPI0027363A7E|nr:class I SAM-dependent methyltransferase [Phenylobacterium sp.]MDP3659465.1 class I SAM-dependent methyltransferase [Phenylobacterium sp.]
MEAGEYALMDEQEGSMWWYRALHKRLIAALRPVRGRVLDAGCGTGGFLRAAGQARPDLALSGLEWDAAAAARAIAKSGAAVARGSVNALPFASDTFDAAISADVLCHAQVDPAATLGELYRILRPGGFVVVNMPAYDWLLSAHDHRVHNARRMDAAQVREMLQKAGFVRVRTRYWNSLLLPIMILERKILNRGEEADSDVKAYPPLLNRALLSVLDIEQAALPALPFGGSVMATGERPA